MSRPPDTNQISIHFRLLHLLAAPILFPRRSISQGLFSGFPKKILENPEKVLWKIQPKNPQESQMRSNLKRTLKNC